MIPASRRRYEITCGSYRPGVNSRRIFARLPSPKDPSFRVKSPSCSPMNEPITIPRFFVGSAIMHRTIGAMSMRTRRLLPTKTGRAADVKLLQCQRPLDRALERVDLEEWRPRLVPYVLHGVRIEPVEIPPDQRLRVDVAH